MYETFCSQTYSVCIVLATAWVGFNTLHSQQKHLCMLYEMHHRILVLKMVEMYVQKMRFIEHVLCYCNEYVFTVFPCLEGELFLY